MRTLSLLATALVVAGASAQDGCPSGAPQTMPTQQPLTGGLAGNDLSGNTLRPSDRADSLGGSSTFEPASAGATILPKAYATTMGNSANRYPHAQHNMRYQQVFLGSEIGPSQRWTQLCLRRDETFGGGELLQNLTVIIGDTTLDHNTIGASFDANYRTKLSPVFTGNVNLPNRTGGGTVSSFDICIPFNRPINWGTTTTINLIVEVQNTSTSSAAHFEDYASGTGVTTTRVYSTTSSSATTGTIGRNAGLIMCLGNPGTYELFGPACAMPCTVLPASAATAMGNSQNTFPHASANMRYQQVFRGNDIGPTQTWTSLSLRRNETTLGGPAQTQNITLILGDTLLDESTLTATFDSNWRTKLPPVFDGNVNLPVSTGGGTLNDFYITFPFNRPITWGGPTSTVHLLLEFVNNSTSATSHYADATSGTGIATTRVYVTGATATTGTVGRNYGLVMCLRRPRPLLYNGGVPEYGKSFSVFIANAPASTAAVLWLGSRTNVNLNAFLPGCWLHATLDVFPIATRATSSSGQASVGIPIPNSRTLLGVKFANQWLALDGSAVGGLVLSTGGEGVVGGL